MNLAVKIDIPENTIRVFIPFDIPKVLVNSGAIELYANKTCGWTAKITNDQGQEIDNPKNAMTAISERLRDMVKREYQNIAESMAIEEAKNKINDQLNQVFK